LMKILLVNTSNNGGAAKACIRLHQGLLHEGIDSKLLLKEKATNTIPETYQIDLPGRSKKSVIQNKIRKYFPDTRTVRYKKQRQFIKSRSPLLEQFSYPYSDIDITQSKLYRESDIVHFHWVAHFLDFTSFFQNNTKPVVWTLHDANPFLGGEHYAERYLGINDKGYPIKRRYTNKEIQESQTISEMKGKTLENVNYIHIVCPSRWLKNESENSRLFSKYTHHNIPNGFPADIFKPLDKNFCREALGIPQDKYVILFVSESLTVFRKGYEFLKRSISNISKKYKDEVVLCAIGGNNETRSQNNFIELGTISDERLMAVAYAAADIFVIPSLEDNLPNTMIESLLCGTPVIGFPTGGIAETIVDSFNGFLCPEINVACLQQTIEKAILHNEHFNRKSIRDDAYKKYNLSIQARAYIPLYENILKTHKNKKP